MFTRLLLSLSVLGLAACSSGSAPGPAKTSSGFAPVNGQGQIVGADSPDSSGGGSAANGDIDKTKAGYAYLTESKGAAVTARAALINPDVIANRPVAGTGTYTAQFQIAEIKNTGASRAVTGVEGTIPLTVQFGTGRVTGRSTSTTVPGQSLEVSGQLADTGAGFTGTTLWRGVEGDLRGRANKDRIIGAFSGAGPTSVYAGGFTGTGKTRP